MRDERMQNVVLVITAIAESRFNGIFDNLSKLLLDLYVFVSSKRISS